MTAPLIIQNNWIKTNTDVSDELDLYNYLIQIYCIFENIQLSYAERTLLTYYMKGGISKETEEKYMTEFSRKRQVVSNIKTSLVNNNLLEKVNRRTWKLPPQFATRWTNLSIVLQLNVVV